MLSPLFHPSILHAFFSLSVSVPSSRSASVFFFTLLTLFVRFACQSALNIVALLLQLLPPPTPLCLARTNRWAADKEIVVAKRRGGGSTRFPLLTLPHYAFYRLHIKVLFTIQAVDLHLPTVHQFVGERYYK